VNNFSIYFAAIHGINPSLCIKKVVLRNNHPEHKKKIACFSKRKSLELALDLSNMHQEVSKNIRFLCWHDMNEIAMM
jgi:hypothetical protein